MKSRFLVLGASLWVVLSLGVLAGACGEDDNGDGPGATATVDVGDGGDAEPTATADDGEGDGSALEDYFQELDEAENAYRVAGDSADAQLSALDDTTLDQAPGIFEEVLVAIAGFIAALEAMDPPDEAVTAHEETIAGFQAAHDLIEAALPDIENAQTVDDVFAPLNSVEFMDISTALDAMCAALQSIADANGITVDLGCD